MRSSLGQQREHVKILAQKYLLYITVDSLVITVDDIYNCFIDLFIDFLFLIYLSLKTLGS